MREGNMSDCAVSADGEESAVLDDAEKRLAQVLRDGGDRVRVVRELCAQLKSLPPPRAADRRILLWREMFRALYPGHVTELVSLGDDLMPYSASVSDRSLEPLYWLALGLMLTSDGQYRRAISALRTAGERAAERSNPDLEVKILINLGLVFALTGLVRDALTSWEAARGIVDRAPESVSVVGKVALGLDLTYTYILTGRERDALEVATNALSHIPAFPSEEEARQYAFQAQLLHENAALAYVLLGKLPLAESHTARAGEWSRLGTPMAQRRYQYHRYTLDAIGRCDAAALTAMRSMEAEFEKGEAQAHFAHSNLHRLYLAARAQGDVDGASHTLKRLSELYFRRCADAVDDLARAPCLGDADRSSPTDQITTFLEARAAELLRPQISLSDSWSHLIKLAFDASSAEDSTRLHPYRTARLAGLITEACGLSTHDHDSIVRAALIHEVGLCAIPVALLQSADRSAREDALYDSHADIGADLIGRSNIPQAEQIAEAVRYHHAAYDGQRGGAGGESLPFAARVLAIADAFDELTHGRPGRTALSVQDALKEILRQRARDFDPQLVDRFIDIIRQLARTRPDVMAYLEEGAEDIEPRAHGLTRRSPQ
jgi:putative two-component system response regulator